MMNNKYKIKKIKKVLYTKIKKMLFLVVMGSIGLSQPKEKMNINGYTMNWDGWEIDGIHVPPTLDV